MLGNQRIPRRQAFRIALAFALVTAAGGAAIAVGVNTADASSSIDMDGLTIPDTNQTVTGNVSDVSVATDLSYSWSVPDAEQVVIKLRAGPSRDELETLTFRQLDATGDGSGTVAMQGSLTELSAFSAEDFDPALAESERTDLVVAVELEVRRTNGETETATTVEPVTVQINDGTTLTTNVGGSGSVTVET